MLYCKNKGFNSGSGFKYFIDKHIKGYKNYYTLVKMPFYFYHGDNMALPKRARQKLNTEIQYAD